MSKPILIVKTGLLCSEPEGLWTKVIDKYECDVISEDSLRLDGINIDKEGYLIDKRNHLNEAVDKIGESLNEGRNVFYDSFMNGRKKNNLLRTQATRSGAALVHIALETPYEQAKRNLEERLQTETINESRLLYDGDEEYFRILEVMGKNILWPHRDDALYLNHNLNVDPLFEKVVDFIEYQQLN